MKCKICGGTGHCNDVVMVDGGFATRVKHCAVCNGTGEIGQTEQEYIQTCNTEQLAEWICSVHEKCYYCGAKRVSDREHCPFGDGKCRNNKHEIAMWLKQPHTNE